MSEAARENRESFWAERVAIRMVEASQSEAEAKRGALEDWERYIAPRQWTMGLGEK